MIFSVVIPAYNCENTIEQTVKSICEVKIEDMEVIIVDDGSTDDTCEVCHAVMERYPCVRYLYQENAGVSAARNYGIAQAVGKYILLWDSDDQADTELLRKCMLTAQEKDADMLIFGITFHRVYNERLFQIDTMNCPIDELIYRKDFPRRISDLYEINYLSSVWNKILKREICSKVSFDSSKKSFEDLLYTLDYLKYCESIFIMPDLAYIYSIEYSWKKPTREKQIDDFNQYMNAFQNSVLKLEEALGVELPELRSRIGNIYGWMLSNKLVVSNLKELKQIDSEKMKVTLFGEPCDARSKASDFYFNKQFMMLRLYSAYRKVRSVTNLNIRCIRYKLHH